MNDCTHQQVIITPNIVKNVGDKIVVEDFEHGELHCMQCNQQLPTEDLSVYDKENVFVGLDKDIVDGKR